jgi:hypothetical protein
MITTVTKAVTTGVGFAVAAVFLATGYDLEPYQDALIMLVNGAVFTYLTWRLPNAK